jgi:peptide/nickel transport system ATP-binding protein/oligopeptide transport system ATP-binding protein
MRPVLLSTVIVSTVVSRFSTSVFSMTTRPASGSTVTSSMSALRSVVSSTRSTMTSSVSAILTLVSAYPHELSGGMRQRVMIAMAISCRPKVLIADEPTTALDVTVQAQIFDLMRDIQNEFGVAIVLITHDMGAIAEMADRVAVMYAGRVVEKGSADSILDDPQHPYTRGLIGCIPVLGKEAQSEGRMPPLAEIPGIVPPLHLLGRGCAFADRCPLVFDRCRQESTHLEGEEHRVACFAAEMEAA